MHKYLLLFSIFTAVSLPIPQRSGFLHAVKYLDAQGSENGAGGRDLAEHQKILGAHDALSIRDFSPTPACDGITDDSISLYYSTLKSKNTNGIILVPADCKLNIGPAARLAGKRITLDGTGLIGEGGRDSGNVAGMYGTRGSSIIITDREAPAIIVKRNWRLEHLVFYWPLETEESALRNGGIPVTMPALLAGTSTAGIDGSSIGPASEVSSGRFIDNDVVNAWDLMNFSGDPFGALQMHGNRIFALNSALKISGMTTESFVYDNQFTPNAFFSALGVGIGPTFNLRNWAANHAAVVLAVGDGTAGTHPTQSVDGLNFSNNYVFGVGYGFRVVGGWINLFSSTGNGFDGTGQVISIEEGGLATASRISGGMWFTYNYDSTFISSVNSKSAVYVSKNSFPGTYLDLDGVTAQSNFGPLIDFAGAKGTLHINDVQAMGVGNNGGKGTKFGINFDSYGGRLSLTASTIAMQGSTPSPCVQISGFLANITAVGNQLINCNVPISFSSKLIKNSYAVLGNSYEAPQSKINYALMKLLNNFGANNSWNTQ